jgi:hypothetical protein
VVEPDDTIRRGYSIILLDDRCFEIAAQFPSYRPENLVNDAVRKIIKKTGAAAPSSM